MKFLKFEYDAGQVSQSCRKRMARNLGHSAEGVAGSEIIASLKIQLKNS